MTPPANPPSEKTHHRPWALITGASEGIGRAFARELAAMGFNVALCARRRALLTELANALQQSYGIETNVSDIDLGDLDGPRRLFDETKGLDFKVVVLAAGFGTSGRFLDNALSQELAMIDLNCRAVADCAHRFGNRVRAARSSATLVLFSSIVAFQGVARSANYAATKAYVQTLAEGLKAEFADQGLRVLSVAPGPVHSGFADRAGMTMGIAAKPDAIARDALRHLGKSTTVRPGFLSKLLESGLMLMPRRGRTMIMNKVMSGMTRSSE